MSSLAVHCPLNNTKHEQQEGTQWKTTVSVAGDSETASSNGDVNTDIDRCQDGRDTRDHRDKSVHVELPSVSAVEGVVDLSGKDIKYFPVEVLVMGTELRELNLGRTAILEVPDQIGCLSGLVSLNLMGNGLESVPQGLGRLGSLQRLGLKDNRLVELPSSIGRLSSLVELYLTGNKLVSLPKEIVNLHRLRKLQLSFNCLRSLPEGMEGMRSLELFRLAVNPDLCEVPRGLALARCLSWVSLAGSKWCDGAFKGKKTSTVSIDRDDIILGELLGGGASGEVFNAEYSGRGVAVKVFKSETSPDGNSRDELDVACLVEHPNLTKVIGVVQDDQGPAWLVMERAIGKPLAEKPNFNSVLRCRWTEGQRFPAVLVLTVAIKVARAMAYLHSLGICHGDLYAHNVLVDDTSGATTLCDYGASFFYEVDSAKEGKGRIFEGVEVRAYGLLLRDMVERSEEEEQCKATMEKLVVACLGDTPALRPKFHEISEQLHGKLMQVSEPRCS